MTDREGWLWERPGCMTSCNLFLDCLCDPFWVVPSRLVVVAKNWLQDSVKAYVKTGA